MSTTTTTTPATYTTKDTMPKTFGLYILYVDQWKKAVEFYQKTLGWNTTCCEENCWAEFETGGIRFAIHPVEEGKKAAPVDTHLSFFIENVDKTVAALRKKNIKITVEPHEVCDGLRGASFVDVFGNTFHFCGA